MVDQGLDQEDPDKGDKWLSYTPWSWLKQTSDACTAKLFLLKLNLEHDNLNFELI